MVPRSVTPPPFFFGSFVGDVLPLFSTTLKRQSLLPLLQCVVPCVGERCLTPAVVFANPIIELPSGPCVDDPFGWVDSTGADCATYSQNDWCTSSGGVGPGWDTNWGTLADRASGGKDAKGACCACGGGATGVLSTCSLRLWWCGVVCPHPSSSLPSSSPPLRVPVPLWHRLCRLRRYAKIGSCAEGKMWANG